MALFYFHDHEKITMKTILSFFLVSLAISGCGGGGVNPVIGDASASTVTTPLPLNAAGLFILKPASAIDAYEGGLRVQRDTTGLSGGTAGHVNTALMVRTIAGKDVDAFEWASLSIVDNHALRGENVGMYAQANKFSSGPTFGGVSEVNDASGLPGAAVGHEIDLFITGPDNGSRIGLDLVVGDARAARGQPRSEQAAGTTGIRVAASQGSPWATLKTGIEIRGTVTDNAILITDSSGKAVFEIKPNGDIYRRGVLLP